RKTSGPLPTADRPGMRFSKFTIDVGKMAAMVAETAMSGARPGDEMVGCAVGIGAEAAVAFGRDVRGEGRSVVGAVDFPEEIAEAVASMDTIVTRNPKQSSCLEKNDYVQHYCDEITY